ncbi:MAG: hypothetical protein QOE82_1310 [Thermoanaerobaculia bacterium]|jgi:hypothetical protein|nr:hypothetical protein [Thermoanaerobaculia bacterium]
MKPIKATKVLQKLMLELIYPAVLGFVLFRALEVTETLIKSMRFWNSAADPFDSLVLLKCLLLFVTVYFYGCDYVYTMLTRDFRVTFFWYDCLFLIGLYVTLISLSLREKEPRELPIAWFIAAIYAGFFVTYLLWDRSERKKVQEELETAAETDKAILANELRFYDDKVLKWERLSLAALLPTALVAWWLRDSEWASVLLLVVLFFITRQFFRVVRRKRHFAFIE